MHLNELRQRVAVSTGNERFRRKSGLRIQRLAGDDSDLSFLDPLQVQLRGCLRAVIPGLDQSLDSQVDLRVIDGDVILHQKLRVFLEHRNEALLLRVVEAHAAFLTDAEVHREIRHGRVRYVGNRGLIVHVTASAIASKEYIQTFLRIVLRTVGALQRSALCKINDALCLQEFLQNPFRDGVRKAFPLEHPVCDPHEFLQVSVHGCFLVKEVIRAEQLRIPGIMAGRVCVSHLFSSISHKVS